MIHAGVTNKLLLCGAGARQPAPVASRCVVTMPHSSRQLDSCVERFKDNICSKLSTSSQSFFLERLSPVEPSEQYHISPSFRASNEPALHRAAQQYKIKCYIFDTRWYVSSACACAGLASKAQAWRWNILIVTYH